MNYFQIILNHDKRIVIGPTSQHINVDPKIAIGSIRRHQEMLIPQFWEIGKKSCPQSQKKRFNRQDVRKLIRSIQLIILCAFWFSD